MSKAVYLGAGNNALNPGAFNPIVVNTTDNSYKLQVLFDNPNTGAIELALYYIPANAPVVPVDPTHYLFKTLLPNKIPVGASIGLEGMLLPSGAGIYIMHGVPNISWQVLAEQLD